MDRTLPGAARAMSAVPRVHLALIAAIPAVLAGCQGDTRDRREPREVRATSAAPLTLAPVDRAALAALAPDARQAVTRATMPVLALADARFATQAFVVEPAFYAQSAKANGLTIAIQGTKPSVRVDGVPATTGDRRVRGGAGFVSENEGIRTATFVENGIAYAVDVECERRDDTRCTEDTFVLEIASALAYVGGGS